MSRWAWVVAVAVAGAGWAQERPRQPAERTYLLGQVGKWDAAITLAGAAEPMKGTLEVRKLGNLWVVSTLKADFGPLQYEGVGSTGYDPHQKKIVGSWTDSITDSLAVVEGKLDGQTLTETWSQKLPEGKLAHFRIVTTRAGKDKMKAEYHRGDTADGLKPIMTIVYTRSKP